MNTPKPSKPAMLHWLNTKLADAEKSLRIRIKGEACFRSGDDKSWAAAADMHPSTAGRPMSKQQRLESANRERVIAEKYRHEAEMFRALIDFWNQDEPKGK